MIALLLGASIVASIIWPQDPHIAEVEGDRDPAEIGLPHEAARRES